MRALPNLARRPFVNRAPVRRTAGVLWVMALLAVGLSSFLYWRHFMGLDRRQAMLGELGASIAHEQVEIDRHRARVEALDITWQNRQVGFLNERIVERSFSWSRLFERLSVVLPRDVRLERLAPTVALRGEGREGSGGGEETVSLAMNGSAKSQRALYEFIDAMFADPAFRRPVLARETLKDEVAFALSVTYLPAVDAMPDAAVEAVLDDDLDGTDASSAPVAGGGA